jgi:hypothetical protein
MRICSRHARATILCISVCWSIPTVTLGQNVAGWALESAPNFLELVTVDQSTNGSLLRFTLRNTSKNPIIDLRIAVPSGNMTGLDAFTTGVGTVEPEETVSVTFGNKDFFVGNHMEQSLKVEAIVHADGSRQGSQKTLDLIEDEMLGAALETKRDSDILAASPDPSAAGLDAVLDKVGRSIPSTGNDAVRSVRDISLPNIPQSYIDTRVSRQGSGLVVGIERARQMVLLDINRAKSPDFSYSPSSKRQAQAKEAQHHATSDLTQKYRSLSETQVRYIEAFKGVFHAN